MYARQLDRKRVLQVYQQLMLLDAARADEFFREFVVP